MGDNTIQAYNLYVPSDERLKTFKEDIEISFEELRQLPKKYFIWKNESDTGIQYIGTSAQAVNKLNQERKYCKKSRQCLIIIHCQFFRHHNPLILLTS